jgi:hypothetical protein
MSGKKSLIGRPTKTRARSGYMDLEKGLPLSRPVTTKCDDNQAIDFYSSLLVSGRGKLELVSSGSICGMLPEAGNGKRGEFGC